MGAAWKWVTAWLSEPLTLGNALGLMIGWSIGSEFFGSKSRIRD